MSPRAYWLLLFVGLVLLPGCGKPTVASVKGKVTCNGKPVAQAVVTFAPVPTGEKDVEPGKAGTGFTDAEGNYVLSTYKPLDGARVGQHRVTVTLDDTNPAPCKRSKQLTLEVKPGDNEHNIELN
jgi:hypothetical protein